MDVLQGWAHRDQRSVRKADIGLTLLDCIDAQHRGKRPSPEADMHPAESHWLPRITTDTPPELPVTAYAALSAQPVPILTADVLIRARHKIHGYHRRPPPHGKPRLAAAMGTISRAAAHIAAMSYG